MVSGGLRFYPSIMMDMVGGCLNITGVIRMSHKGASSGEVEMYYSFGEIWVHGLPRQMCLNPSLNLRNWMMRES